jgi:hypothetical protein
MLYPTFSQSLSNHPASIHLWPTLYPPLIIHPLSNLFTSSYPPSIHTRYPTFIYPTFLQHLSRLFPSTHPLSSLPFVHHWFHPLSNLLFQTLATLHPTFARPLSHFNPTSIL